LWGHDLDPRCAHTHQQRPHGPTRVDGSRQSPPEPTSDSTLPQSLGQGPRIRAGTESPAPHTFFNHSSQSTVGFPAAQRLPHRRSVTITNLKLRPAPARVLVHWAGYAPEEATWEPLATISDTNVRRYVSSLEDKSARKQLSALLSTLASADVE